MLDTKTPENIALYHASSMSLAMQEILKPSVVAVTAWLGEDFKAACNSYDRFASENQLTLDSECFYKHNSAIKENYLSRFLRSELTGCSGKELVNDGIYQDLHQLFTDIGFRQYDSEATAEIVNRVLQSRQDLADLFPKATLAINTQINVGSTYPVPHIHNNISFGISVSGPTTIFISPTEALKLKFKVTQPGRLILGQVSDYRPDNTNCTGMVSVAKNHAAIFKGAVDKDLIFSAPENLGAVHLSPSSVSSEPRMFIVSFLYPPGWGEMRLPSVPSVK